MFKDFKVSISSVGYPLYTKRFMELATVYIKGDNVIKYRYYSKEIPTPDNVLGKVTRNNPLNLITGNIGENNVEDYGVSLKEIHNRIEDLKNAKDRVVIEKDRMIYIYVQDEYKPWFEDVLKRPELKGLKLEDKVVFV